MRERDQGAWALWAPWPWPWPGHDWEQRGSPGTAQDSHGLDLGPWKPGQVWLMAVTLSPQPPRLLPHSLLDHLRGNSCGDGPYPLLQPSSVASLYSEG